MESKEDALLRAAEAAFLSGQSMLDYTRGLNDAMRVDLFTRIRIWEHAFETCRYPGKGCWYTGLE